MSILRDKFVGLAAPVMAATLAFSAPAWAEDNPANSNVPVTNASVSTSIPVKMTKPQYVGASDDSIVDARIFAQEASRDKVAIVFWGGTKELQIEGYKAVMDLIKEGVPVAFVAAPATHVNPGVAIVQIYSKSAPSGTEGVYYPSNLDELASNGKTMTRDSIYESASIAYQKRFPQQIAQLDIQ